MQNNKVDTDSIISGAKMRQRSLYIAYCIILGIIFISHPALAWHDETHIAIAKVAGHKKWFNAAAADIIKIKAGDIEYANHFVNNPPGRGVKPKMVIDQAKYYNTTEKKGHLYGAIIASVRDYQKDQKKGKYGQYHLAFCAHYVGDLSQPLHNTIYNDFNKRIHVTVDGIINDEVLGNLSKIKIYPITITSEYDLAKEIARIANISISKGYALEKENRALTKEEAYECISHSASLFKAILNYVSDAK